tara:strand:+ start:384 stop:659 length:276 start_codon:yes stop_codon:yes gene_type:complete
MSKDTPKVLDYGQYIKKINKEGPSPLLLKYFASEKIHNQIMNEDLVGTEYSLKHYYYTKFLKVFIEIVDETFDAYEKDGINASPYKGKTND